MTKTISVFCAREQQETPHNLDIDGAGEVVLTCTSPIGTEEAPAECGRFLKFPKGTTSADLKAALEAHKASNEGQITQEAIEAQKDELLAGLAEPSAFEPEPEEDSI